VPEKGKLILTSRFVESGQILAASGANGERRREPPRYARSDGREVVTRRERLVITIRLVVLILMLIGSTPSWPYSRSWGYGPSGVLGILVLIVLILALSGHI
jgi:hypothetical protein